MYEYEYINYSNVLDQLSFFFSSSHVSCGTAGEKKSASYLMRRVALTKIEKNDKLPTDSSGWQGRRWHEQIWIEWPSYAK